MSHHKEEKDHKKGQDRKEPEEKSKKQDKKKDKDKKLKKLEQEREELDKQYRRALADYQNLLKRTGEEKEGLVKYANEGLLKELLPVFDHLKLSLQHVSEENKNDQWVQGVEYVVKQFREVLKENGVKEIEVEGKEFDPEYMEAVEGEGDTVKREIKPGYTLNGKVIIPAKVEVEVREKDKENEREDKKQ